MSQEYRPRLTKDKAYTTFKFTSLTSFPANSTLRAKVSSSESLYAPFAVVGATITNTGTVAGAQVAQLYVSMPDITTTPLLQLRGFQKVLLQPGESKRVEMVLRRKDISVWDVVSQQWILPDGDVELSVGSSAKELPLHGTLTVKKVLRSVENRDD